MELTAENHAMLTIREEWISPDNPREWGPPFIELKGLAAGELEGLTYTIRFDLVDGEIVWTSMLYEPLRSMPLLTTGQRRLRTLHQGGVPRLVEKLLRQFPDNFADAAPWLEALTAHRKRAGVAGKPDHYFARIAQARVDAQDRWPNAAIRNMATPNGWPDLFPRQATRKKTDAATSAKCRRAVDKGMLEKVDGRWRLTERAIELLTDKRDRGSK